MSIADTSLYAYALLTHSPQTLFARNEALSEVAKQFGLGSYDGMDVGPVAS
jgi:hypothetical protein